MKLKIAAVFLTALFLTGCSMESVKSGVAAVPVAVGGAVGSVVDSTVNFVKGIF